jgi:hypothetical protein
VTICGIPAAMMTGCKPKKLCRRSHWPRQTNRRLFPVSLLDRYSGFLKNCSDKSIVDELLVNARRMLRWSVAHHSDGSTARLSPLSRAFGRTPIRPVKGHATILRLVGSSQPAYLKKVAYVRSPNVQRLSTFREELVPLIYGRNP